MPLEPTSALIDSAGMLSRLITTGVPIAAIIVGAWLVYAIGRASIVRACRRVINKRFAADDAAQQRRADTLIQVFSSILGVTIFIIAALMIFERAGVAIGPLLAGAGVAGVAIGFGAQYIVRDVIGGLFALLENQYRAGDIVSVGNVAGVVEDISLRTVSLRDLDGAVHHIPHGEVQMVTNWSEEYARVNLNVPVAYESDLEHVIRVINGVGEAMAHDEYWGPKIREAPAFLRVDKFGDSAMEIKVLGEVEPLQHPAVTGELRKRLKIAFDEEGIIMPYPRYVIFQREYPGELPM